MNILFVTESKGWSGGANQIILTGKELTARGHRITLAAPEDGVTSSRAREAGIKTVNIRIRQDYDVPAALALKRICREEKADIIHAHHPQAHAIALIARYLGAPAPLVVTRRVIFRIRVNPFSALKYRSSKIASYIAVCNATKNELVKGGVRPEKVAVIPSAVSVEKYAGARLVRPAFSPDGEYRVGMIGHYSWFKGHDIMLKAAPAILKACPKAKFVFAGRDTDKLAPLAESLGLKESVEILGERNDVPAILSTLHLFAMPSLQEGIATALIEAQCAGVPAVASDIGGIPDVMIPGETGIMFPADDPAALAAAVIEMARNPSRAAEMAAKGIRRAEDNFSLSSVCTRLENFYSGLAGQG